MVRELRGGDRRLVGTELDGTKQVELKFTKKQ